MSSVPAPPEHDRRRIPSRAEYSASGTQSDGMAPSFNGNDYGNGNGNGNSNSNSNSNYIGNGRFGSDNGSNEKGGEAYLDTAAAADGKRVDPNANTGTLDRQLKSRHV